MTHGTERLLCACVMFFAASCGSDSASAPRTPPNIQLTFAPVQPKPGSNMTITATASPPTTSDAVAYIKITTDGLVSMSDSLGATAGGAITLSHVLALPLDHGSVHVVATAKLKNGAVGSNETQVQVADLVPPTLTSVSGPAAGTILQPGDTLKVSFWASDDISLRYTALRVSGGVVAVDSVGFSSATSYNSRIARVVIPRSVTLGGTAQAVVEAMDVGGNVTRYTVGSYSIQDVLPPAASATISGGGSNGAFSPGSQMQLTLTASDNLALQRVGYSFGIPAMASDSFAATGASFQKSVSVGLSSSLKGTYPLTVFALDSAGNRTSLIAATVTVDSRTRRPIVSAAVSGVRDLAYDAKRSRIYASQPDSNSVAVISLPDGSRLTSLSMPGNPRGIDLSPGNDSLLAALYGTLYLGVYNLNSGTMDTVRLPTDQFFSQRPDRLRVMGNGRAVISFTFGGSGYGGKVSEFDLRTKTVGSSVSVTERTPMARSMNRQRLYALIDDSCCPEAAFSYDAGTGKFSGQRGTVSYYFPGIAADYTGATVVISNNIFDANLSLIRTVPTGAGSAVALSPDGTYVYAATTNGVAKVRVADGSTVESFSLASTPTTLLMLPDGLTLVAATSTRLYVIDLW